MFAHKVRNLNLLAHEERNTVMVLRNLRRVGKTESHGVHLVNHPFQMVRNDVEELDGSGLFFNSGHGCQRVVVKDGLKVLIEVNGAGPEVGTSGINNRHLPVDGNG